MLRKIIVSLSLVLAGITLSVVILLVLLFASSRGEYSVYATTATDPGLPVIDAGDYRFHGAVFGNPENQVIFALHGGPGGDFRYILPLKELSDDYCVIFYDQRGAGLSPRVSRKELTADQYVKDLDTLIEKYSPGRPVILIGHSWGAMLASIYTGRHPEKVDKAVLAEPGFLNQHFMDLFYERSGMNNIKFRGPVLKVFVRAFGESLHVHGPDRQARKDYILNRLMASDIQENPMSGYYRDNDIKNSAVESWRFGAEASSAIPESGLDENGRMTNMTEGIDQWPGTALFISGSENSIIGPDFQTMQMKLFPRARLEVIQGAGHTMIGEKPEETLMVIRKYLSE